MFYFDSNTTRRIIPAVICCSTFWKAYIDRMSFGLAEGSTYLEYGPRSVVTAIFYRE